MRRFLFVVLAGLYFVMNVWGSGEEITQRFDMVYLSVNGESVRQDLTLGMLKDGTFSPEYLNCFALGRCETMEAPSLGLALHGDANAPDVLLRDLVLCAIKRSGRFDVDSIDFLGIYRKVSKQPPILLDSRTKWLEAKRTHNTEVLIAVFSATESIEGLVRRIHQIDQNIGSLEASIASNIRTGQEQRAAEPLMLGVLGLLDLRGEECGKFVRLAFKDRLWSRTRDVLVAEKDKLEQRLQDLQQQQLIDTAPRGLYKVFESTVLPALIFLKERWGQVPYREFLIYGCVVTFYLAYQFCFSVSDVGVCQVDFRAVSLPPHLAAKMG